MCGIAGQIRSDGDQVEEHLIHRMCAAQEHRGPDSRGVFVSSAIGLGIQRLRIIDLETGDQPVYNEDGSIAVVLNGEIYNFAELRAELTRAGHKLATAGDTEVIAHLYEEYGIFGCLARLKGMFAFALWDATSQRLVLARDRVGKKPLYYSLRGGVLSFASELNALLQDTSVPRDVDPAAIDAYLAFGYVPAPMSAYSAVRKLPPAHVLVFQRGAVTLERYWQLDYSSKRTFADPRELEEEIREALRTAVGRRLVGDVPVGAFLSGGVDSAAVVAAMAEQTSGPVKTFSIGFTDDQVNELPRARMVAERFSTEHHELMVEPDAVALLPKVIRHYGEPFGDHSALPCFYLAQLAREHVTVALNGDGGDECFAGYQRYTSNMLAARLDAIPGPLRGGLAGFGRRFGEGSDQRSARSRLTRFLGRLGDTQYDRYLNQVSVFNEVERAELCNPAFRDSLSDGEGAGSVLVGPWRDASGDELLDRLLEVDTSVYLPGDLLAKIDIATMAYSLEGRSPLLDHEFMELAASIPANEKARGTHRKVAFRNALRGWIPDEVIDGRKQGFELPVARWLRTDLAPFMREVLLDTSADRGWTRPEAVEQLIDQHVSGSANHGRKLWSLLALELWAQAPILSEEFDVLAV